MKATYTTAAVCAVETLEPRKLLSVTYGNNLILNPGAENYDGTADGYNIITPKDWSANNDATVASYKKGYGALIDIRIPSNAGNTFFAGGPNDESTDFFQTIDLSSIATALDAGQVSFKLGAEIGGNSTDGDNATVSVNFKDASQTLLQQVSVGNVSASDRDDDSKFIERTTTGTIDSNVRFAQVQIHMKRDDGLYNDGFADNLSLVLTTNTPSVVGITPSAVKSTLPAVGISGQPIKGAFTLNLTNTSTSKNDGVVTTALYACGDGLVDSTSIKLTSVSHNLKFQAGKSIRLTLAIKSLPLAAGSYTILAQTTDSLGTVVAAATGPAVAVEAPVIALTAEVNAVSPIHVGPARAISVSVQIANAGNISATGLATITLGLSSDGTTIAVPLTSTLKKLTLRPNAKPITLRFRMKIPIGTTAGTYKPLCTISQGSFTVSASGTPIAITA